MPSKLVKAPAGVNVRFEAYSGETVRVEDRSTRETVVRIIAEGPSGERSTFFVAVNLRNGRFRAEISQDQTRYEAGPSSGFRFRSVEMPLVFWAEKAAVAHAS